MTRLLASVGFASKQSKLPFAASSSHPHRTASVPASCQRQLLAKGEGTLWDIPAPLRDVPLVSPSSLRMAETIHPPILLPAIF